MYFDDYGFPVEGRVVARVIEVNNRGFGFAVTENSRIKLYFHMSGLRQIQVVDGVCEWRRFSSVSGLVLPIVGQEIVFDKLSGYNDVGYWSSKEDFDKVYYPWLRQRRPVQQLAYAGC